MFIGRKEQYVISLKDAIDEEFYNCICMSRVFHLYLFRLLGYFSKLHY